MTITQEKIELFEEAIIWHGAKKYDEQTSAEAEWIAWAQKRLKELKK